MRLGSAALLLLALAPAISGVVEIGQGGTLATNRPFSGS